MTQDYVLRLEASNSYCELWTRQYLFYFFFLLFRLFFFISYIFFFFFIKNIFSRLILFTSSLRKRTSYHFLWYQQCYYFSVSPFFLYSLAYKEPQKIFRYMNSMSQYMSYCLIRRDLISLVRHMNPTFRLWLHKVKDGPRY